MGLFDWGKSAEGIGNGVATASEGIRYLLSGDLPPEVRVSLEKIELEMKNIELKVSQGQVELNKIEAQSSNIFKSGWRPAIGWIGTIGLFYNFIGYPLLQWYIQLEELSITAPDLNSEGLMSLVFALLGLGGFRTYEKFKGVTK